MTRKACFKPYRKESNKKGLGLRAPCERHQAAPRWMRGTAWTCRQSRHQAAPRWARDCLRWLLLEVGLFSFVQLPSFFLQILGRDFTLVMFGQKRALGLVIKVHNAGA